jgi:hypothetical protein
VSTLVRELERAKADLAALALRGAMPRDPVALARAAGFEPDPWQAGVLRSDADRVILNACRQSGKSTTVALLSVWTALRRPGSLTLLVSPTLRQSSELFLRALAIYRALGRPVPADAETRLRLELANGSRVISLPGSESTIRGYSAVDLLAIDEASRVPDALYLVLLPMLAISRGKLLALSTPYGRAGWFFEAWERGDAWERVKIVGAECPRISPEALAEYRASMPARWFAQEFEGEFSDADDAVFAHDDIMGALDDGVRPLWGVA